MNNWEKYKEDIEKNTENSKTTIMCVVNEFSKVCKCSGIDCDECQRKNVEWLTQEAESKCETCENNCEDYDYFCESCINYAYYKPKKEVESEEPKSKEELMEEVGCDGCDGCYRDEPQQSKARFIKVEGDVFINVNQIVHMNTIGFLDNETFIQTTKLSFITNKPINEVIQQLGIEVI